MKLKHYLYALCAGAAVSVPLLMSAADSSGEGKLVWALLSGKLEVSHEDAETGLVQFNLNDLSTFSMVDNVSNGNSIAAGFKIGNDFYWYEYKQQIYGYDAIGMYAYNIEDGVRRQIADYGSTYHGVSFYSPTYDYQTNTVYALDGIMGGDSLMRVDVETGDVTKISAITGMLKNEEYNMEDSMKAIAVNYDGDMYGVSYWGRLYKINMISGEATLVADLDFNPEQAIMYECALAFDNDTNELYWSVYTWVNRYKEIRRINIADGTTEQVGIFGDGLLFGSMDIPFTVAEPGAPAKVSGFTVTPDPDGALGATIKWTNPTKTYGRGGTLESIDKVEVYCNNELVQTFESPAVGAEMTWHSEVPVSALYSYKVMAYNASGKGDRSSVSIYVGQGIPMPVTNLKLESVGANAHLTWTAPDHGKFDAYIDIPSLRYEIIRSDGVTVADAFEGSDFTDDTISTLLRYTYTVKAKNIGGESETVITDPMVCGPSIEVPTTWTYSSDDEFNTWTVIDGNGDYSCWSRVYWPVAGVQSTMSYYEMPAHEYLISPKVNMNKGTRYKVTFDATPGSKHIPEVLAVSFGRKATPEAQDSVTQYVIQTNGTCTYRAELPEIKVTGDHHFGFVHRSDTYGFNLTLSNVRIEEDHDGCVQGRITCNGNPVTNAIVLVNGGQWVSKTDADGKYLLEYLPQGSYTADVNAIGFEDTHFDFNVTEFETVTYNADMTAIPAYTVKGVVRDAVGDAVTDAHVSLGGYNSYEATTGTDGSFSIPGVFRHEAYSIVIDRNKLLSHSATFDVEGDLDLGEVVLNDNLKTPYHPAVEVNGDNVEVSWLAPINDPKELRYDSGEFTSSLGVQNCTTNTLLGTIFPDPEVIYGTSFVILSRPGTQIWSVYVTILDLDENGQPTDRVLYQNTYVPVTEDAWTTLTLPAPLDCPNGCFIGVSSYQFVSLAVDNGLDSEYPFKEGVHCFTTDYENGEWAYLDQTEYKGNFAIRAQASTYTRNADKSWRKTPVAKSEAAPAVELNSYSRPAEAPALDLTQQSGPMKAVENRIVYNVYRADNGTLNTENPDWVEIATDVKTTFHSDTEWKSLPKGVYRYGVKAVYANGETSELAVTDSIGRDMRTALRLEVMTNTATNEASGAVVNLISLNPGFAYNATIGADGKCLIDNIWKTQYTIEVTKPGFGYYSEIIDLSDLNEYSMMINLVARHETPSNLQVFAEGEFEDEQLLVWNFPDKIFEDFEGHEDFAINSPGEIGWQYRDGDNEETGSLYDYEWPGAFGKMAFMVFNPYNTNPAVTELGFYPLSGEKMLADFAAVGIPNDDWLISPRLFFTEDFKLQFFAKGVDYYPEVLRIGYSETGIEDGDFIWLEENLNTQSYWMNYEYDIPASAKYVAINCISKDKRILFIDDVTLAIPSAMNSGWYSPAKAPARKPIEGASYEIYLDGEKVGATDETNYLLTGIPVGHHRAGVRAAYTSGYSDMAVIDFDVTTSGIVNTAENRVKVNLAGNVLTVRGDYNSLELHDLTGLGYRLEGHGTYDLGNLPTGVYVLTVKDNAGAHAYKLQVK